jgi:hypothetical protein
MIPDSQVVTIQRAEFPPAHNHTSKKNLSTDKILKAVYPDGTERFRCGVAGCDFEGDRFQSVLGHLNKHSEKAEKYWGRMRSGEVNNLNKTNHRPVQAIVDELVEAASSGDAALQRRIDVLERKLADERARRRAAERDLNAIRRVMRQ